MTAKNSYGFDQGFDQGFDNLSPRLDLDTTEDLGHELKLIRLNQSLSLQDLAESLGRSERQMYRYENKSSAIPHDLLIEWLNYLGYKIIVISKTT